MLVDARFREASLGCWLDELEGYVRKLHKNATPMLLERCNELTNERGHTLQGSTKVDHSILDRSSLASGGRLLLFKRKREPESGGHTRAPRRRQPHSAPAARDV